MKIQRLFFVIAICVGLVQAFQTEAANIILENSRTDTLNCAGKSYSVFGNKNRLTFKGNCESISVQGNWNVVSIEAVKAIQVTGNSNEVQWGRAIGSSEPEILNTGSGNTILTSASGTPKEKNVKESENTSVENSESEITIKNKKSDVRVTDSEVSVRSGDKTITVIQDNQNKTIDCGQGGSVAISGDANTLKIVGQCSGIALTGSENKITVNLVSKIKVTGDRNEVYWKEAAGDNEPAIQDIGSSNTIQKSPE